MRYLLTFFSSLWHGLDVLRRVLHLLLMLALLTLLIVSVRGSIPRLPERGALIVHPSGDIVEQLAGEPLQRALSEAQGESAPETLLWDLTRAIRAARTDAHIQALLIETDDLASAGQPELEELAAAIRDFRASGKKVIAHGTYFLQGQYYLAAQADEVYLDPFGFVLLPGYDLYRMYFKDAIDKLAVDVHLVRAGKFKSADEPFVRRDMSDEERQESAAFLQSLWLGYRGAVGAARHLDADAISRYADGYAAAVQKAGGDMAAVAKAAGLVTALRTDAQVEQRMAELVGGDDGKRGFQGVNSDEYLRTLRAAEHTHRAAATAVGVIMASGEMYNGNQPAGTIGGESTAALLRQARQDDAIKAVVLRIDSPGGSVLAAEQIYREVQLLRAAGKPVIASMGRLAASGGYYIAAPADEIIASANTITGSIGVFATVPTFDRTLAKLGVHVDGVGTTALSGSLRLDRPLQPDIAAVLQSSVDHSYAQFVERVASGRRKTPAAIDAIAQGRVWAGRDALRLGLVDRIGGYDDAVHAAAGRANLGKNYDVRVIEPELSFTEQLLLNARSRIAAFARGLGLGRSGLPGAALPARLAPQLQPLERELARWQRLAAIPQHTLAYCLCNVD
ncbi:MAG TPA: signal peptide peptidase SppA [Steroidobacteraceae bacterium]|nr:signal peptide peptidase SppA [Steroidobacteraceae bacterium]